MHQSDIRHMNGEVWLTDICPERRLWQRVLIQIPLDLLLVPTLRNKAERLEAEYFIKNGSRKRFDTICQMAGMDADIMHAWMTSLLSMSKAQRLEVRNMLKTAE